MKNINQNLPSIFLIYFKACLAIIWCFRCSEMLRLNFKGNHKIQLYKAKYNGLAIKHEMRSTSILRCSVFLFGQMQ